MQRFNWAVDERKQIDESEDSYQLKKKSGLSATHINAEMTNNIEHCRSKAKQDKDGHGK
jgi:hypothetical protein